MNNQKTGLILSYTATILNMLCGLFLSSFLLRSLGDFEYGLYQTIAAFVNYLVVLEFGISTVMTRNLLLADEATDPDSKKKVTATLFCLTLALSAIILAVGIVFCCNIKNIYADAIPQDYLKYSERMFIVLLGYLMISFISNALSGVFLGNENYNIGNAIKIIRVLLRTLTLVIGISLKPSAMIIAVTDASISILVLIFILWYVKTRYLFSLKIRYFDFGLLKESFPLCIALLLQAIINQVNNNVDKMVISIKLSIESVSLYSVAMYIYSIFSTLTTIPVAIYLPQVSDTVKKGIKSRELADSLIPSGRLVALIGGGILFGFAAVGRQFITLFYGEAYTEAWVIALVILVPMFINMTGGNMENVLKVCNKLHIRSYILIFTTLGNIILTIFFVDRWGMLGAATATGISLISGEIILSNIFYYKKFRMNIWRLYFQSYRGILPAEILAMLIGGTIGSLIHNPLLSLLTGGVVYVGVAAAALLIFGLNAEEKRKFRDLTVKIRSRKLRKQ